MFLFSSCRSFIYLNVIVSVFLFSCDNSSSSRKQHKTKLTAVVNQDKKNQKIENEKSSKASIVLVDAFDSAYQQTLSLFDVPVSELYLETELGTAHVLKGGNPRGNPVVLLHGMNASSTMWYPNFKALSVNYHVFAIDFLLEPNRSKSLKENYSPEEIAAWYESIFKQLNLDQLVLVGASRGGWLSVNYCINYPSRVKKLVLLSPAQTFTWISPSSELLANISYTLIPSDKRFKNAISGLSADTSKLALAFVKQFDLATVKSGIDRSIFEMRPFSSNELEKLNMPVYLLIGDKDFINGNRSLKLAKKRVPDIKTAVITRAGHFLSIDQAKKVNREILQFIK